MICPACGGELVSLSVGALTVDVCRHGCGGIWFDNFELCKVDEANEQLGEELLATEFDPQAEVQRTRRDCPKCIGVVMMQHKFSPEKPVMVDECPKCGGMWLDGGELAEIRRKVPTADDRRNEAQQFLNRAFMEDLARLKARRTTS
jgi:Zn-finger nucleic acid-binding protein